MPYALRILLAPVLLLYWIVVATILFIYGLFLWIGGAIFGATEKCNILAALGFYLYGYNATVAWVMYGLH